jgi:MoaA/NifB/PqqE/SkfB family radical SAM enzyme
MNYLLREEDIKEVELELTGTCNLNCPLCTRNYHHADHMMKHNERPISDIINQLDKYKALNEINLAGAVSEPTLYKDFFELIKYLVNRNIKIELYTNGNTRNISWWKELAKLLTQQDKVNFTICGSSQGLHEKYRKGSNLQTIIDNAMAFKNINKNDYLQYIVFEYNKNDLHSIEMKKIIEKFNNFYKVESEGIRRLTDYKSTVDITPQNQRDKIIKHIFKNRAKPEDNIKYDIMCKSFYEKKIYINQFGGISACYIHAEFEGTTFDDSIFNYQNIMNFKYQDCFLCEKRTKLIIDKCGLDFVC